MVYDSHIFISYAHLDNQPLTPDQEGWVTRFHESLQTILTVRMGHKALIWRDRKLSGNDSFADEIVAQFPKTEILVSVLSKCYVESEWCRREVQEFCRNCGEVRIGNKYRIIKVVKLPVDSVDPLPPLMKDMLGYDFFTYKDKEQGKIPLELDPFYFPELRQLYIEKLYVLADDIIELTKKVEGQASGTQKELPRAPARPQVFLAQCSWDQRDARDALDIDLRQHSYPILPERPLPDDEAGFKAEVSRLLDQCRFAIHLVGGSTGLVPDGPSRKSAVVLQNELAIVQSKKKKLRRVIWLPDGTASYDPDQKRFIDVLHTEAEAQFGADLITGDLEALKAAIHSGLQKLQETELRSAEIIEPVNGPKLVFLICDQKDREAVLPLRKVLKNRGFEARIPVFEGDAATVDRAKQELLTQCNAAVIFYGKGDEGWKRAVDSDLLKSKGYRSDNPLRVQVTYLSCPVTTEKTEMIQLEEPNLINGLEGFSEKVSQSLLEALKGA
jgi:TIR domain